MHDASRAAATSARDAPSTPPTVLKTRGGASACHDPFEKYLRRSGGEGWGDDGDDGKGQAPEEETGHGPGCEARKSWRELELEMKEAKELADSPKVWSKAIDGECEELPWIKAYRIAIQAARARRACLTAGSDSHGRAAATFEDVVAFWQAKGW